MVQTKLLHPRRRFKKMHGYQGQLCLFPGGILGIQHKLLLGLSKNAHTHEL